MLMLAVLMLLNAWSVSARADNGPSFVVDKVSAKGGETVDISIRVKNNPGITSIKLEVTYPDVLTLKSVTPGSSLGSNFLASPEGRYPLILNWYDGLQDITGDWIFATLRFAVDANAPEGTHSVDIHYDPNDVFNVNEENVTFAVENGGVLVGSGTVAVSGVALDAQSLSLSKGDSVLLSARVSPGNATNKTVAFTSSNPAVACVDARGRVTAVDNGTAVITVTTEDGGKTAMCTVTVGCTHSSKTEVPAKTADCENPGNAMYYICESCAQVFKADGVTPTTREAEEIPAAGHNYEAVVKEPTCTDQGYTTYTCACGDSYVDSHTEALGHAFTNYVPDDRDPDAETALCDRCGAADTRQISNPGEEPVQKTFPWEFLLLGILLVMLLAVSLTLARRTGKKKK